MTVWTIVAIVIAFLGGGAVVWAVNKFQRNAAADNAENAVNKSKDSDSDRDKVLHNIDETIEKNKEIRDKINKMLEKKQ